MKAFIARYASIAVIRKMAFAFIVLFIVSELLRQLPALTGFNQAWIDAHTRDNGLSGVMLFLALATGLLCVGMPRQVVAFLAGYAFGFAEGLLYATLAATVSCTLCFSVSRLWARRWINRKYPARIVKINRFLQHQSFLKTVIIRLLPVGNNLLTNLIAGVTSVRPLPFILGSAVGYVPQMMIFSLMGKGVVVQSGWKMALSVGLMGLSGILGFYLYRRFKASQTLVDESGNPVIASPSGLPGR